MNTPPETILIELDADTAAQIAITIVIQPNSPAPLERETRTVPTARQLAQISQKLSKGNFTFAPVRQSSTAH